MAPGHTGAPPAFGSGRRYRACCDPGQGDPAPERTSGRCPLWLPCPAPGPCGAARQSAGPHDFSKTSSPPSGPHRWIGRCGWNAAATPIWDKNPGLSLKLMARKLEDAQAAGAEVLATACTYCQIQFEMVRDAHPTETKSLPAQLYPQLLGIALGLPHDALGLSRSKAV